MKDLQNKTVLLTGCNRGIGYTILEKLAEHKCNIIACTRNENEKFTKKIDKNFILNELSKILAEFDHSCMEEISRDNVSSKLKNKIFYIEMDLDELALKDGLDRLNNQ